MDSNRIIYSTDWVFKEIPKSNSYLSLKFLELLLLYITVWIPMLIVVDAFFGMEVLFWGVIIAILVFLIAFLFMTLDWYSLRYTLETTRHVRVGKYFDVRSGNIIVERGILNRKVTVHSVERFGNCEIRSGLIESALGFGTLMVNGDYNLELVGISNPHNFIFLIQDMIDDFKGNFGMLKVNQPMNNHLSSN